MNKQPHVLRAECGDYLRNVNAWRKELTPNLQEARVYPSETAANNSRKQKPRYYKGSYDPDVFTAVPVKISEDV